MKTTSIELSERLDELGLKRKGSFAHVAGSEWISTHAVENKYKRVVATSCIEGSKVCRGSGCSRCQRDMFYYPDKIYPAYTLDEILEMLPCEIQSKQKAIRTLQINTFKTPRSRQKAFRICYALPTDVFNMKINFDDKNPTEAAGLLLEWCIKNGYVKVEELNNAK